MPFVYASGSAQNFGSTTQGMQTSGTANTEIDAFFITTKTTVPTRNVGIQALYVGGKGAGLTAISGISYRLKKWTTTSSSAGTALTPAPRDIGMQAARATAATGATAQAGVTSGTGGPTFLGGCVSGAAGPGGWVAPNADSLPTLEGGSTQSIDLFTASGTTGLFYDFILEHIE
jgi:hypothetical protein